MNLTARNSLSTAPEPSCLMRNLGILDMAPAKKPFIRIENCRGHGKIRLQKRTPECTNLYTLQSSPGEIPGQFLEF